ncbi:MAG: response regulator [Trueperaceae bacterium]|nr:response regulator [Trueperaceae bacterium]
MANIVVLEDQRQIAQLVQIILKKQDHQVHVYRDGANGFEGIKKRHPDLAIIDIGLPSMDGFEVAERLRQEITLKDMPILFLTALGDIDSRVKGLQVADDYLSKPFQNEELLARVEALLRRTAAKESLRGNLETIGGVGSALQIITLSYSQGAFILDDGVILYLVDGKVVHVNHPDLEGEAAVSKVLERQKGSFRFDPSADPPERNLKIDPMRLILNAAKQTDEQARDSAQKDAAPVKEPSVNETADETADETEESAAARKKALESLDVGAKGLTVVADVDVARTYIDMMQGLQRFKVSERWDEKNQDTCLLFEGQVLILVALHSTLDDLPEDMYDVVALGDE